MNPRAHKTRSAVLSTAILLALLAAGLVATLPAASAQGAAAGIAAHPASPGGPDSPCAGGPVLPGTPPIPLDECYVESFSLGGVDKTITVWYTKQQVEAIRTIDNQDVTVHDWLDTDAQAQQVAAWGRQAMEQYHAIFNRTSYQGSCNDVDVQMEDGIRGWADVPQPYGCWIHMGSAYARNGGDPLAIFHEFAHGLQDSYPNCLLAQAAGYPGNAEYVEGYACVDADAVDATWDAVYFDNFVANYDPAVSFFDHDGDNVGSKYYLEQVGHHWSSDPVRYHMDAVRAHYEECEAEGTLYVLDSLIPTLTGGALTHEKLFLNFFAANWAKDWADPSTQPELVYSDDDTLSYGYGQVPLAYDVMLFGGSQTWPGETTPDKWAATYYQVRPGSGCDFVTVAVDGEPGAHLGINLMAADIYGTTSVSRAAWIGEDLARTFPGYGVNQRLVAIVNAFDYTGDYDVQFSCVSPAVDLLEPRPAPNSTLVGEPDSPIAFLARFQVTSAGSPVMGLPESLFTADAEGDAVAFVSGSFQQVGEQYWAIMLPPAKPAGTTFVDMQLCLDDSICDTNADALLYVDRGSSDFGLVFDASGSMSQEDLPGEGTRVDNAKKAGNVLAGLLQDGDRVLVMDFSAFDDPPGCGLPGGDGNCELDLKVYLQRTDVTVPGTIDDARDAIDLISPRGWTPIGAALREAKNKLQAAPYSLNPKVIVLLSDGEENVRPLYDEVKSEIFDSGTIVNTVGFGLPGQVGEAKLAQIAGETGGTFCFVPTVQGAMGSSDAAQVDALRRGGVSEEILSRLTATWQPGPLALDNVYDYFDTQAQGACRLFSKPQVAVPSNSWRQVAQYVDDSTGSLRFVVAAKQAEDGIGSFRFVSILPPGGDPRTDWIEISPPGSSLPPTWDVRNSPNDDAVIIPDPERGVWTVRARYFRSGGELSDFVMMASAQSDYALLGRFLAPVVDNQGHAGDVVPIVATLLHRKGAVPGATVAANVDRPGGSVSMMLLDDGQHSDGAAGDGIYGALYVPTDTGGAYNVHLVATWDDPLNPGNSLQAEWLGAFDIEGPVGHDADGDGMPDDWERRCGLDPNRNDANEDLDGDGLSNYEEFAAGSLPCEDDTDHGGENDGSEVHAGRQPWEAADDAVRPLPHFSVRGLDVSIRIDWAHPRDYGSMRLWVAPLGQHRRLVDMGDTGTFLLTGLANDHTYELVFQALDGTAEGAFSDPQTATPRTDSDPPSGYVLIDGGRQVTHSTAVTLTILAWDIPLGMGAGGASTAGALQGGSLQMQISNSPFFEGAAWEPLAQEKGWTLGEPHDGRCVVYARFRDAAGNESLVVSDDIRLEGGTLYLPLMLRQAP